jgi:hypothetical protein
MAHDGPFDDVDFNAVREQFGNDVAWDTLYALGFGSDDWAELYPEVTGKVLTDAAVALAASRNISSSRTPVEEIAAVHAGAKKGLGQQATPEQDRELIERVASRSRSVKSDFGPKAGDTDELFSDQTLARRNILNAAYGDQG